MVVVPQPESSGGLAGRTSKRETSGFGPKNGDPEVLQALTGSHDSFSLRPTSSADGGSGPAASGHQAGDAEARPRRLWAGLEYLHPLAARKRCFAQAHLMPTCFRGSSADARSSRVNRLFQANWSYSPERNGSRLLWIGSIEYRLCLRTGPVVVLGAGAAAGYRSPKKCWVLSAGC